MIGRDAELASLGKLLADILQQTLEVKLLITSRECLNLHEEWLYESQGLAFPRTPNQDISSYSARTLFIQSARRARVNYTFTEDDAPAVAQICHLLEGNPLGIELAASWMLLLSCHEIAQEMKCNLDFLAAPIHGVPNRHLSMRAVFDHSWNLLSELERSVLHQLSVFHGGFQRGAAEQVTGADLLTLSALVDKSLIRRTP